MPNPHPPRDFVDWLQIGFIIGATIASLTAAIFGGWAVRLMYRAIANAKTDCSFRGWIAQESSDGNRIEVGGQIGLVPVGSGTVLKNIEGTFKLGRHIQIKKEPQNIDAHRGKVFSGTWQFDVAFFLPELAAFKEYKAIEIEIHVTTRDGGGGKYRDTIPITWQRR